MMKKKLFYNSFICCLLLLTISIISGCSTKDKKDQIISLQRHRINKLEKQLQRQNQAMDHLKANKWATDKVVVTERMAVSNVNSLVQKGQLVQALRESSKVKKTYPRSLPLRSLRVKIFQKMGLSKQAQKEKQIFNKLRSQTDRQPAKR